MPVGDAINSNTAYQHSATHGVSMKFLTTEECSRWIGDRESTCAGLSPHTEFTTLAYSVLNDSGKKTCIARAMAESLAIPKDGLLWITGWNIFPSGENMELFHGYRLSLGESRPLSLAPRAIAS